MPSRSELFPEAEVRRWGRFSGAPTDEQLSRFFLIGPGDLERVDRARSEVTRLGYAVQLCTVRFLGAFPADPSQTPPAVVRHVARQVGADAARWDDYVGSRARLVHQEASHPCRLRLQRVRVRSRPRGLPALAVGPLLDGGGLTRPAGRPGHRLAG